MRIIHLSDLHFGTESDAITTHLIEAIRLLNAGLIIISGDFTQVASDAEFQKAQQFMKQLEAPVLSVPGNHDISRFNVVERFFDPYKTYREYISDDLSPVYTDDKMVIAGFNTARRALPHWNWANGAFSGKQRDNMKMAFAGVTDKYRIVVMHHPIHKAENQPLEVTVFGAGKAMDTVHKLGVDLVLTGHVHYASITTLEKTVFASASTAISHRTRNQSNGFNVIDLNDEYFEITHYVYNGKSFDPSETKRHTKNR